MPRSRSCSSIKLCSFKAVETVVELGFDVRLTSSRCQWRVRSCCSAQASLECLRPSCVCLRSCWGLPTLLGPQTLSSTLEKIGLKVWGPSRVGNPQHDRGPTQGGVAHWYVAQWLCPGTRAQAAGGDWGRGSGEVSPHRRGKLVGCCVCLRSCWGLPTLLGPRTLSSTSDEIGLKVRGPSQVCHPQHGRGPTR